MTSKKVIGIRIIACFLLKYPQTPIYNQFHNILRLLDILPNFPKFRYFTKVSPQVKRCAIITYKHDIYELPHEFQNKLRLRILGN